MKTKRKKKSAVAILLSVFGCLLLAVILVFAVLMYAIPAFERTDRTAVEGSADWMGRLPDRAGLNAAVLPGTHDSATKNVQLAFFSKCQSLSIGEQLEAGFRYLDIRLAADGDRLKFMHEFTNCTETGWPWSKPLYLDTVLEECYAFLDEHPTETVVFAVRKEYGPETVEEFQKLLMDAIAKDPDRWILSRYIQTVGESRGKIVLVRRYLDSGYEENSGVPLVWAVQGNRGDTGLAAVWEENPQNTATLLVQDRFKYSADEKWAAFLEGLRMHSSRVSASSSADPDVLGLHFLSTNGNTSYGHPYKYAKELNARFLAAKAAASDPSELKAGDDPVGIRGWIIVDFGSPKLAEAIYSANFQ